MLKLSMRERELLMLNQQGLDRENMAGTLYVSYKTIKNTLSRLFKKSDTKKIAQVEKIARTHRLIYNDRTSKGEK